MTERELREKLQFAYGTMPDATRAAFEHSLTHHRAPETHRNIGLSRTMRIVMQNIVFAIGIKAAMLLLGAFGIANMWEAVFADVGVTVLAVLNSLRAMRSE